MLSKSLLATKLRRVTGGIRWRRSRHATGGAGGRRCMVCKGLIEERVHWRGGAWVNITNNSNP